MHKIAFVLSLLLFGGVHQSSFAHINQQITTHLSPVMRGELTRFVKHTDAANILTTPVAGVPSISAVADNVEQIKTVLIPADKHANTQLDVTLIDEFIEDIAPNARHYPTNFPNRTAEYVGSENIKHLSDWLEPYASAANASFDVVLRAAKINGMARNLNIGTDYALRANNHMAKAIKLMPNHAEANFLYGMMISEAGGFKEGKKYLDKAASLGYLEAEQSLAQTELLDDKKSAALSRLKALQIKHPDNHQIAEQVRIVEGGDYYIWNIKDSNLSIKPFK
ncbi:MAG: hypothetical protein Q4A69_06865 [Moraxella sp.]|nr:hypothetical protein [Moraxella sp.]